MSVDSVKIFNGKVKELNDASSHRSLFLDNERYNNILQEVKETQILRKNNQPLTSKHYRRLNPSNAELNPICPLVALFGSHHILHVSRIRVKRYDVMKIGDTQKRIESGSGENDD